MKQDETKVYLPKLRKAGTRQRGSLNRKEDHSVRGDVDERKVRRNLKLTLYRSECHVLSKPEHGYSDLRYDPRRFD